MTALPPPFLTIGDVRSLLSLPDTPMLRVQVCHHYLLVDLAFQEDAAFHVLEWLLRHRAGLPTDLASVFSLEAEEDVTLMPGDTPVLHPIMEHVRAYLPRATAWLPSLTVLINPWGQYYHEEARAPYLLSALREAGLNPGPDLTEEEAARLVREGLRGGLPYSRAHRVLDHAHRRSRINTGLLWRLDRALIKHGLLPGCSSPR